MYYCKQVRFVYTEMEEWKTGAGEQWVRDRKGSGEKRGRGQGSSRAESKMKSRWRHDLCLGEVEWEGEVQSFTDGQIASLLELVLERHKLFVRERRPCTARLAARLTDVIVLHLVQLTCKTVTYTPHYCVLPITFCCFRLRQILRQWRTGLFSGSFGARRDEARPEEPRTEVELLRGQRTHSYQLGGDL